ncbi:MFS transporter small subunit [Sinomonas halotolerans]
MKAARVALGWTLVGVPLLYGITMTLIKASALFG